MPNSNRARHLFSNSTIGDPAVIEPWAAVSVIIEIARTMPSVRVDIPRTVPRAIIIIVVETTRTMPRDVAGGTVIEARGIRLDAVGWGGRNHTIIIVVAIVRRSSRDNVAIAIARRNHAVVIVVAVVGRRSRDNVAIIVARREHAIVIVAVVGRIARGAHRRIAARISWRIGGSARRWPAAGLHLGPGQK